MILQSSLMLLVVGATVVASRLWKAFLLLLAPIKFLIVSCCWSLCYCEVPGVTNGVVGVPAVPFKHAVASGPAVDGVLAVASVPADPYVHILAVVF
jgi:hypothetical protein